ncbi:MAG TPA: hypothetical protein VFH45_00395 [Acidimicrobiales bacterium]|nr:hypothetical protein [Acidimicrobiales bacterium]
MRAGHRRRRGEAGFVAGLDMLVFGVLIMVVGVLVVADAWGVVSAKTAAVDASAEAVRAFVRSPSSLVAADDARRSAVDTLTQEGRDPARAQVGVTGALVRCHWVTVTVSYRVPLVNLPLVGGFGRSFTVSAHHTALVDPYRNGPAGPAVCNGLEGGP